MSKDSSKKKGLANHVKGLTLKLEEHDWRAYKAILASRGLTQQQWFEERVKELIKREKKRFPVKEGA